MRPTDIHDKMRRTPDGILDLPELFSFRRRSDQTPNKEAHMQTLEFDEADLIKALTTCLTEAIRGQAVEGIRVALGDSKALLRQGCQMLMRGDPLYQLPQGVLDELEKWRLILGLSLTQLASLLRDIQLGVVAASDNPPPSQAEECEALIGRSLAASPHARSVNPLYCTVRHERRFAY